MLISRFRLQSGGCKRTVLLFKKHDFSQICIRRGPTCCHYLALQEQAVLLTALPCFRNQPRLLSLTSNFLLFLSDPTHKYFT